MTQRITSRLFTGFLGAGIFLTACNMAVASSQIPTSPSPTGPSSIAQGTQSLPQVTTKTQAVFPVASPIAEIPLDTPTTTPLTGPAMISAASQDVNCRYGPGVGWLTVGALKAGQSVPVYGSDQYRTWWEIDSSWNTGEHCWVSGQVTTLSGDYLSLPVLGPPEALVIAVQVKTTAVVHGTCGGPNPTDFTGVITTNGPATVIYHWEIYNTGSNSLLNTTSNISLVIAAAGIQSFSSSAFTADCGTYLTKLVVTSPGSMTGQANWSVVHP